MVNVDSTFLPGMPTTTTTESGPQEDGTIVTTTTTVTVPPPATGERRATLGGEVHVVQDTGREPPSTHLGCATYE